MESTVEVEVVPLGLSPVKVAPIDASFSEERDKRDEDIPPSNQATPHSFRVKHAGDPTKFKPVEVPPETPNKQSPKNAFQTFKKNFDAFSRKISLKKQPANPSGSTTAAGGFHSSRSLDHDKSGDLEETSDTGGGVPPPTTSQSHIYLHKKISKGFSAQLTSIFKGAGVGASSKKPKSDVKTDKAITSDKDDDTMAPKTEAVVQEGKITFQEPNRYFVDGYKNWHEPIEVDNAKMKDGILITRCENVTIKLPNKVTKIELAKCKQVNLFCPAVISSCDIQHTDSCVIEFTQRCPGLAISNSQSLKVYIPRDSMEGLEIASSGDGTANIMVPDKDDPSEYKEVPVPFQFVHHFKGEKLVSEVSPLYIY